MPIIFDLARFSLDKYCSLSQNFFFITRALCAGENCTLHSRWIVWSKSSCKVYSLTSLFTTHCTLKTLGLCGSFTVHLISYHICLLSSRMHFYFIAVTLLCCFLFWASIKQSHRQTLQWPFAYFRKLALQMQANCRPSLSLSIVSWLGCSICCHHANRKIMLTFFVLPSFIWIS